MADTINKAQKRQHGNARRKAMFSTHPMRGIKNKIRRMRTRLRRNPNDRQLAERLAYWEKDGARTRKGTKWGE